MLLRPPRLPWMLFGLAAVLILFFSARAFLGKRVETQGLERGDLVETIVATGRIITPARVALGPQMAGTLAEVRVREGDTVKAGQLLARLVADEPQAASEQSARAVAEAEARLIQQETVLHPVAEQARHQAAASQKLAEQEFKRISQLVESGFYSPSKLDESRRSLDNARAVLRAATAQAAAGAVTGADTLVLETRLEQARAAQALAQARLAQTRLIAPADGLILGKWAEAGDVLTAGRKVFDMAIAGELQIELQVDEKNLARLAVGQPARFLADAYPGQPLAAQVFYIAPGVDAGKGAITVKLRVSTPAAFLKPDMTVSVEMETGRKTGALLLPERAVRDAASAHPWVLVAEAGRALKRAVQTGLRSEGKIEIVSGLSADARVIPSESSVQVGERVR